MTKLIASAVAALSFALCLALPGAALSQTVTRDQFGREIYSTTRSRDSVTVRDRFGREVLTTRKGSNR